jgi:two-component system alkaline phosphatase synthesis response regulator PhoP
MSAKRDRDATTSVLVVDDNPQVLDYISESLHELGGFRVVAATNGEEGLARYHEAHPQCVVIDVKMPGMNGYQLVRALRGDPESAATPLILLTALAQDKHRAAGMASGCDYYLVKPIKPLELVAAIRRAMALDEEERLRRWQQALASDTTD